MKKLYRLKKNEDFRDILNKKKSFANRSFVIYYTTNTKKHTHVSISISKKVGNAVVRNKCKRQVRMMVQEIIDFQVSTDYVIIIRKGFLDLPYEENRRELEYLYHKIKRRLEI